MKKFLVYKDNYDLLVLAIGNVDYHIEFLPNSYKEVIGGGRWNIDKENKIIWLYGSSHEFGAVSIEDMKLAKDNNASPYLEDLQWNLSEYVFLDDAKNNFKTL